MRHIHAFMPIYGLVVLCSGTWVVGAEPTQSAGKFAEAVLPMREAWRSMISRRGRMGTTLDGDLQRTLRRMEGRSDIPGQPLLDYLLMRVHAGHPPSTLPASMLPGRPLNASMAPEFISIMQEYFSRSPQQRVLYDECLALLLPMSGWSGQIDAARSVYEIDINPPRAIVPLISRTRMIEVAEKLEQCELYDLSWRGYAEAIYAGFRPPWVQEGIENSWLSPEACKYWYKAAECAKRAGKNQLAWDYLTKAAVCGSDELHRRAHEKATEWNNVGDGASQTKAVSVVDRHVLRTVLVRVAQLYVDMHAHPRAWAIIDAYHEVLPDAERLGQDIRQQWLVIVKDLSRGARKVTVYGQEVYPKGDPLKARVPWSLSDQSLATVSERLLNDAKRR